MATATEIGTFIDQVAGQKRKPSDVAGRLIEEVTELCLSAGLTAGDIMAHVVDALHNQALKASKDGDTVFPSALHTQSDQDDGIPGECADVSIVLKDFCHVAQVALDFEENLKWARFTRKTNQYRVTPEGTVYLVKTHVKSSTDPVIQR